MTVKGIVILRDEGSKLLNYKILRFAQNDKPGLLHSVRSTRTDRNEGIKSNSLPDRNPFFVHK